MIPFIAKRLCLQSRIRVLFTFESYSPIHSRTCTGWPYSNFGRLDHVMLRLVLNRELYSVNRPNLARNFSNSSCSHLGIPTLSLVLVSTSCGLNKRYITKNKKARSPVLQSSRKFCCSTAKENDNCKTDKRINSKDKSSACKVRPSLNITPNSSFVDANLSINRPSDSASTETLKYFHFHSSCTTETINEVSTSFEIVSNYLNCDEEEILMKEVEPHLQRLKYEFDHWDNAIHGFREVERGKWGKSAMPIILRMKKYAFLEQKDLITQVHILDLAKTGVIKPHVDSVRFCGNIISGLCLLSDAVMRLVHVDNNDQIVDVMLPRKALYVMRDSARYNYTHEVLGEKESFFGSTPVARDRRISIICRNNPK